MALGPSELLLSTGAESSATESGLPQAPSNEMELLSWLSFVGPT